MGSKIKINLKKKFNVFIFILFFGHGKTIHAPIVGDFSFFVFFFTSNIYHSIIRVMRRDQKVHTEVA